MRFRDIIYFAYKYYFKSPLLPSDDSIITHFKNGELAPELKEVIATVSIGGDLMPYAMIKPGLTDELWDKVGTDFFGSDIVFANLETPLDTSVKSSFVPEVMLYDMHFNSDETTMGVFSGNGNYKGYDILSVANNHSMDQGLKGIDKTIEYLNFRGVRTVGARSDHYENPHEIFEINGIRIGFLAFTFSLNQFELPVGKEWKVNVLPLNVPDCSIELIKDQVIRCRKAGADFIICSLHAGNAYQPYPSSTTVNLYERIFSETGIDVIAGGHPHNLQPWRNYKFTDPFNGREKIGFAIYSLGDFIAYDIYTWCHLCAYLKIEFGKDKNGNLVFRTKVYPMVMQREDGKLKLDYAENVLNRADPDSELKDIKVLYDICML